MRIGMFATATFYGKRPEAHASVPASAILHLHDREWVYILLGNGLFWTMMWKLVPELPEFVAYTGRLASRPSIATVKAKDGELAAQQEARRKSG